jgi:hypothetical protein
MTKGEGKEERGQKGRENKVLTRETTQKLTQEPRTVFLLSHIPLLILLKNI